MYNIIDKDIVDTAIQNISQVYDNNKQVNSCTVSLIKPLLNCYTAYFTGL